MDQTIYGNSVFTFRVTLLLSIFGNYLVIFEACDIHKSVASENLFCKYLKKAILQIHFGSHSHSLPFIFSRDRGNKVLYMVNKAG